MTAKKDLGTDNLLVLNGDRYFVDEKGEFEVVFKVVDVEVTPQMPHGLKYSLMLSRRVRARVRSALNNLITSILEIGSLLMTSKMP